MCEIVAPMAIEVAKTEGENLMDFRLYCIFHARVWGRREGAKLASLCTVR